MKIALLGCGFIGRTIAAATVDGRLPGAQVVAVADLARTPAVEETCGLTGAAFVTDSRRLLDFAPDLVVEAAGQEAARQHAASLVSGGADLMLMSVGALVDSVFRAELETAAKEAGRKILIPSGAIGALDVLRSAMVAGLDEVTLVTRKPPTSLAGSVEGAAGTEETVLFDGPATEAVRLFPKNVNVAAAVSLAGVGFERTRVTVVSDPAVSRNTHTLTARGAFGEMRLVVENLPSPDNPKTSYLAALSAIAALTRLASPLQVG